MRSKFFEELSRCLGKEQIESLRKEDRRLEIFLHGQPVLSVSAFRQLSRAKQTTTRYAGGEKGYTKKLTDQLQ